MSENTTPNPEEAFAAYIADKRILVVDASASVRSGIAKVFKDLGAKTNNILLAPYYETAVLEIKNQHPHVIVTDYHLDDQCGLKLIEHQRRALPNVKDTLFVLVTANARESTIAEAAEEEVDSYILKPFTMALCRDYIIRAALAKIHPTFYRQVIEQGKVYFASKDFEKALTSFQTAIKIAEKPTLAYYYYGQVCTAKNDLDQAQSSYSSGLKFNEFHYKCLTGLFDVYIMRDKSTEAYEVARKLASAFPVSPAKLDAFLRLAVKNEIFDDMESYFDTFVEMDYRSPELTKCMMAGLVVGGMYYLSKYQQERGFKLFEKAMIVSNRSPSVLREIVMALVNHGAYKKADEFLKQYPPIDKDDLNYQTLELVVLNGVGAPGDVIGMGRKLLKNGVRDVLVYEILVKRAIEAKQGRIAEAFAYDAATKFPHDRERFLKMVEGVHEKDAKV